MSLEAEIRWRIKPADFLAEIGYQFRDRAPWLAIKLCPFCKGGDHVDKYTFVVHKEQGNYSCSRAKCLEAGNFWMFIEKNGRDPKDYIERDGAPRRRGKKKPFMYRGRKNDYD